MTKSEVYRRMRAVWGSTIPPHVSRWVEAERLTAGNRWLFLGMYGSHALLKLTGTSFSLVSMAGDGKFQGRGTLPCHPNTGGFVFSNGIAGEMQRETARRIFAVSAESVGFKPEVNEWMRLHSKQTPVRWSDDGKI